MKKYLGKQFFKQQEGITIVALVVTIVVLLILAGVSLSLISGSNGIVQKAAEAADKTQEAQATEQMKMKLAEIMMRSLQENGGELDLAYIADLFCEMEDEVEYVRYGRLASLEKLDPAILAAYKSIFVKLKAYDYEFEIGDSCEILSVTDIAKGENHGQNHNYANSYKIVNNEDTITDMSSITLAKKCAECGELSDTENLLDMIAQIGTIDKSRKRIEISSGKTISIDLNGKTLQLDYYILNKGTMSLSNGNFNNKIYTYYGSTTLRNVNVTAAAKTIFLDYDGKANIIGGRIRATGGNAIEALENAQLSINGTEVTGTSAALAANASYACKSLEVVNSTLVGEAAPGIFMPGTAKTGSNVPKLTVSGSTIRGLCGIDARSGQIEISNSEIVAIGNPNQFDATANCTYWDYVKNYDEQSGMLAGTTALFLHSQSPYNVGGILKITLKGNINLINSNENNSHKPIRIYEHGTKGVTTISIDASNSTISTRLSNMYEKDEKNSEASSLIVEMNSEVQ